MGEWGRKDVWTNGVAMFFKDPLTGVGAGNFAMAIGRRRLEQGLIEKWQAPHNAFVQILTEVGIVGIVTFVMLVTASLKTFWRLRRRHVGEGDRELALCGGLLFAGFMAVVVTASFLSMGYSLYFTLYFAAAVALRQIGAAELPAGSALAVAADGGAKAQALTAPRRWGRKEI